MTEKRRPCLRCAAQGWRDSMYEHATRDHDRLLAEAQGSPRDKCGWCGHERAEHSARDGGCMVVAEHTRRPTTRRDGCAVCDCSRFAEANAGAEEEGNADDGSRERGRTDRGAGAVGTDHTDAGAERADRGESDGARSGGAGEHTDDDGSATPGGGSGRDVGGSDRKSATGDARGVGAIGGGTPAVTWADAIAASAARDAEERAASAVEIGEDYDNDYARVMAEARDTYGPGRIGLLRWVDARGQMLRPAVHPIDRMWIAAFAGFYNSGRLVMLARKGLRAGGSSSACPALTRCAVFGNRKLDAGTIGVIPIMSATRDEADGRFVTIRSYLRAIGLVPPKKGKSRTPDDDDFGAADPDEDGIVYEVAPGGIAGTFRSRRSPSGGGVIALADRHGHRIQFRILPALVKHGVGYTGAAGLADESDLWPNDPEQHVNPAERIFDRIAERFTTTYYPGEADPGAEFLIFSASYNPDSAHKRAIDDVIASEGGATHGPNGRPLVMTADLAHLVRIGEEGARADESARRGLAAALGDDDARLLAPGDPMSPDLPAWVFNPPETIEKCYRVSKNNIGRMLAMYGGRASENKRGSTLGAEDLAALASFNREPVTHNGRAMGLRPDGLLHVHGYTMTGQPGAMPVRRRGL